MTRQPAAKAPSATASLPIMSSLGLPSEGASFQGVSEHVLQRVGVPPLRARPVLPDDFLAVAAVSRWPRGRRRLPPESEQVGGDAQGHDVFHPRVAHLVAISVIGTSRSRARCPSGSFGPDGRVGDDEPARRPARAGCGRCVSWSMATRTCRSSDVDATGSSPTRNLVVAVPALDPGAELLVPVDVIAQTIADGGEEVAAAFDALPLLPADLPRHEVLQW